LKGDEAISTDHSVGNFLVKAKSDGQIWRQDRVGDDWLHGHRLLVLEDEVLWAGLANTMRSVLGRGVVSWESPVILVRNIHFSDRE
jgi:hypothetical protein